MTETELNEQISEICSPTSDLPTGRHPCDRAHRRLREREKYARLRAITLLDGYAPHRGYVDWDYVDGLWQPVGKYIKYPKNSNCQRWIKRVTSKKVRRYPDMPFKGNRYRKVFDYWWTLY